VEDEVVFAAQPKRRGAFEEIACVGYDITIDAADLIEDTQLLFRR
jgi:hypothetical protein